MVLGDQHIGHGQDDQADKGQQTDNKDDAAAQTGKGKHV
jgi:hypothetical protein